MTKIGIAIVEINGLYLVGTRPPTAALAGFDEFPGGKQLFPESTQETAQRECLEETGLRVCGQQMLHQQGYQYEHDEVQLDFWLCAPNSEYEEGLPDVDSPWRWVPREELSLLNFPPANAAVVDLLCRQSQFLRSEF